MSYDFKSESEVKEFLHNLGIEYRFGCYGEKKPDVCHLLGDYLEAVKKDFEKAAKVYKFNCDDYNHGKSCFKYGTYCLLGKGGLKEDLVKGFQYMANACELNEPDACFQQGMMILSNQKEPSIESNQHKGLEVLEKGCQLGHANACYYLSAFFISGLKEIGQDESKSGYSVKPDMHKAFQYAEKACHLGNIYGCANLSRMYNRGDGVKKNEELASKYKQIALEMQEEVKSNKTLTFGEGLN